MLSIVDQHLLTDENIEKAVHTVVEDSKKRLEDCIRLREEVESLDRARAEEK